MLTDIYVGKKIWRRMKGKKEGEKKWKKRSRLSVSPPAIIGLQ